MPPRRSNSSDPLAHLAKTGPKPVYALYGPERILVDEALDQIKAYGLPKVAADFNLDIFVGREATATKIADAARMLPAFAASRMVIVKDAEKLAADTMESLLIYLTNPSPTTVLVFVAEKLDARTKFFRALKKAGAVMKFDHPQERQMPTVVKQRAKRAGVTLDDGAIRALVAAIGSDVAGVASALEKLLLYVGPQTPRAVNADDVATVVSHVREESVFMLSDAIGGNDVAGALELLHGMLSLSRSHPLQLLGLIAGHWRRLTVARALMDHRAPKQQIEAALGLPPFITDKVLRQARHQTVARLVGGLRAIAAADKALKGGKLPPHRVMERLVLKLA